MVTAAKPVSKNNKHDKGEAAAEKWVYLFTEVEQAEALMKTWDGVKSLLGGKGSGLFDMTRAGVPVPPGLTVTTRACNAYSDAGGVFPPGMWDQVVESLRMVEERAGKQFGSVENPLLVSVRSG
ncbi:MAG: hypothetical protein JNL34_00735, partial [Anaerolineae bacterium]|nr:hypothetical protein [Anaerolineae bacterium]